MWKSKSDSLNESLHLLELAIDGTKEGITISDMLDPERPLIFVNEGFEYTTGYKHDEVLGRNCRFLQGPNREPENEDSLRTLKKALDEAKPCTVLLKNYRKSGELFWNRLSLTPLFNDSKVMTHFIGVQTDVTSEVLAKNETASAYAQLKDAFAMMEQDLAHASFVQQSILPTKFPQSNKINFAAKFQPMTHIGGDFYDVFEIESGKYGVMIADVTGHGASAALLTLMAYDVFKEVAKGSLSPKEVLHQANEKLYKRIPTGKFITMFYGVIDEEAQTFTYCQAGHPCGYVIKGKDQTVHELSTKSSLLGVFDASMAKFDEKVMQLNPGDKILMYTDALIEIQNIDGKYFGSDSLEKFLSDESSQTIAPLLEQLYQNGLAFINSDNLSDAKTKKYAYNDDMTLLGFEVNS